MERLFRGRGFESGEPGVTQTAGRMGALRRRTVTAPEADLEGKEGERREVFWERVRFGLGDAICLGAIPRAVIAAKMVATPGPNRDEHRYAPEAMAAMETEMRRSPWPFMLQIFIGENGNLHQRQDKRWQRVFS